MNVCVGDIIKLENNQFVAVRDKVLFQSAGLFSSLVELWKEIFQDGGLLCPVNVAGTSFSCFLNSKQTEQIFLPALMAWAFNPRTEVETEVGGSLN